MKEITYAAAIGEAMDEEMARDDSIVLMGEDVAYIDGTFKTSVGLLNKYGPMRVVDTPISESGFTGMAVGMALTGMRPIVEYMFGDFLLVAADQVFNQAAKLRYMTAGQVKVPMVIRVCTGGGRSMAAQHSQCLQAMAAIFPGLKIALPSTAQEAKGLLKTAIRDDNPVMFFESKMLYNNKFTVDDVVEPIPFGKARKVCEGNDVTIVATSSMVLVAEQAVKKLNAEGITADLLDLRTIVPLDMDAILESVHKTGKLLICDEGYEMCNIASEIGFQMMEKGFYDLDAPVARLCTPNTSIPFCPVLEKPLLPTNPDKVYDKVKKLVG